MQRDEWVNVPSEDIMSQKVVIIQQTHHGVYRICHRIELQSNKLFKYHASTKTIYAHNT